MHSQRTRVCFVFLFFLVSVGVCVPNAVAENRALDVYLQAREKEWGVLLKLIHPGSYSIASTAPEKIILDINDTVPGALFLKHLKQWGHVLTVIPDKGHDLRLLMKFPKPVREVRSGWNEGKKVLTLRFFMKTRKSSGKTANVSGKSVLEGLRFGIRKKFVRTVMDLTSRPLWRLSYTGTGQVNITLHGVKNGLGRRKILPGKGIRKLNLKTRPGELGITLQFETGRTGFRLFWLEMGDRLVLDSYRVHDRILAENTTLPSWFGKPEKPSPQKAADVPLDKSLLHQAMPEISPVVVQGPLVADPKKQEGKPDEKVKVLPKGIAFSEKGTGPKVTIAIPRPEIITPPHEKNSSSVKTAKHLGPKVREKKKPKFESKEAALYGAILRARDLRHTGRALGLIAKFLTTYPDADVSEQLRFMKADILLSMLREGKHGMLSKVVEAYQDVINSAPGSDLALKSYLKMARAYAGSGNHYLGISCLDLAIHRYQKRQDLGAAYLERGEIYLEKNLSEKAVDDFKTVLRRYPTPNLVSRALFGIARYLQARGLYREAQKRLAKIEKMRPRFFIEEPDFLSVQAQNYLYLKEYEKARAYFYRAVNLTNQQESTDLLLMHIGDTYLQESKRKKAEKFYILVKNTYPTSDGASIAELRLGELHQDVNKFKKIENKHPNGSIAEIAALKLANAYYKAGLYQKTMASLKKLVAKPPKDFMVTAAGALFARAAEGAMGDLYKKGKFSALVALFHENEALLKGKIRPDKQILVAQSLQELKDYPGAIAAYRDLDPSDLNPGKTKTYYLGLADCLSLSGFSQESIHVLEEARKAQVSPSTWLAITGALAERYNREKRFKEAYELYAEMIQQKKGLSAKDMANIYLSMGRALNEQGKYEDARAVLNRSIALSDQRKKLKEVLVSALGELGKGYMKEKRYSDALGAFTQALRRGYEKSRPGFWDVRLGEAEALLGLRRRSAAENVLNEIYEGRGPDPRYWDLRYRLAIEYVKAGNLQMGEKLLRQVSEEGTPVLQAEAQIKLGSLILRKQLEKLSIWPQIGGLEQKYASQ